MRIISSRQMRSDVSCTNQHHHPLLMLCMSPADEVAFGSILLPVIDLNLLRQYFILVFGAYCISMSACNAANTTWAVSFA